MALCRRDQRLCALQQVAALCAFATVTACSLDSSPTLPRGDQPPPVAGQTSSTQTAASTVRVVDGSVRDVDTQIATGHEQVPADPDTDGGEMTPPQMPTQPSMSATDAGAKDAGTKQEPTTPPTTTQEPMQDSDPDCMRAKLKEKAEAYLKAMNTGDTSMLMAHPRFRYTENGRDEQLGAGAFLRRGESQFSRHLVDESRCTSVTQAVMNGVTGRFSFAVRLRYLDGQLLESEAQVVPEALADTDLNAVIPAGADMFAAEVAKEIRMPRATLLDFAQRYFDSASGVTMVPPSAPDCRRRQNGVPLGDGTCTTAPGSVRFEQQRIDLADELDGVAIATVLYQNHIGIYLMKMFDNKVQSIEIVGGASTMTTGW